MPVVTSLSISASVQQMQAVDAWVRGGDKPKLTDQYNTFAALINGIKNTANTADALLTDSTINNPKLRSDAAYTAAVYRDTLYALSGRCRLLKLGLHNAYRETYGVGKAAVNAKLTNTA